MRIKHLIENHFFGCKLLAETYDKYRCRKVSVFFLPGEPDLVGVFDGTDAWVAPVSSDPFSVNVASIIIKMRESFLKNNIAYGKKERRHLINQAQTSHRHLCNPTIATTNSRRKLKNASA